MTLGPLTELRIDRSFQPAEEPYRIGIPPSFYIVHTRHRRTHRILPHGAGHQFPAPLTQFIDQRRRVVIRLRPAQPNKKGIDIRCYGRPTMIRRAQRRGARAAEWIEHVHARVAIIGVQNLIHHLWVKNNAKFCRESKTSIK